MTPRLLFLLLCINLQARGQGQQPSAPRPPAQPKLIFTYSPDSSALSVITQAIIVTDSNKSFTLNLRRRWFYRTDSLKVEIRGAIGDTNRLNVGKADSFEIAFKILGRRYRREVPLAALDSSGSAEFSFSFKRPLRRIFRDQKIVIAPTFPKHKKVILFLESIDVTATNRKEDHPPNP